MRRIGLLKHTTRVSIDAYIHGQMPFGAEKPAPAPCPPVLLQTATSPTGSLDSSLTLESPVERVWSLDSPSRGDTVYETVRVNTPRISEVNMVVGCAHMALVYVFARAFAIHSDHIDFIKHTGFIS